ncbi:hypothetical protein ACHHYP_15974 [Achlya hypogyna]|uniref:MARVEL domain-containing protein n=1 Tax=Achlya hypogyna TaxID=1202772 RepID=A0A1V9Y9W1_ACHHY|nr:hypothetical protein ACHHYP_15974 [Achlya hypogyna]
MSLAKRALAVTGARTLQVLVCIALIVAIFMSFDTVVYTPNGKIYRFTTTPMMLGLMAATAGMLFSLCYSIFVLALDRVEPDVLVERIFDFLLALCLALCGIFTATLGSCSVSDPETFHCSTYSAMTALTFVCAVVYAFSLVHSLVTLEISHPDAVENLVPRGNYGRASSPRRPSSPKADDTLTIMPRGNFGSVQPGAPKHGRDEDNTDELMPRGKFGSIV